MRIVMRTVICFGTFDVLHLGHLNYFQQAKKYGDYLIAVIARDKKVKKKIIFSEEERLKLIKHLRVIDEAVLGDEQDFLKIIEKKKPAVICLGYDHQIEIKELKEKLNQRGLNPEIKRMKSYQQSKYKSSLIKNHPR